MDNGNYYSEINAYDVIVLIEVMSENPGAWVTDQTNPLNQRRGNEISVCIREWLKGDSSIEKGSILKFTVTQTEPISGRIADDYGPWSGIDLESKPHVLIFCNSSGPQETAEQMLTHCALAIKVPNPLYPFAVEDVQLAMSLKQNPTFPQFLATQEFRKMMAETWKKAGPLLARFLIAMAPKKDSQVGQDLFYEIIEAGDAQVMLRAVFLAHLVEQMTLIQDPPRDERIRLIRAMIQILREAPKSAKTLQEGIEQAYLYNTVFDPSAKPYISADQIFLDDKERTGVIAVISNAKFSELHRNQLYQWLRES